MSLLSLVDLLDMSSVNVCNVASRTCSESETTRHERCLRFHLYCRLWKIQFQWSAFSTRPVERADLASQIQLKYPNSQHVCFLSSIILLLLTTTLSRCQNYHQKYGPWLPSTSRGNHRQLEKVGTGIGTSTSTNRILPAWCVLTRYVESRLKENHWLTGIIRCRLIDPVSFSSRPGHVYVLAGNPEPTKASWCPLFQEDSTPPQARTTRQHKKTLHHPRVL